MVVFFLFFLNGSSVPSISLGPLFLDFLRATAAFSLAAFLGDQCGFLFLGRCCLLTVEDDEAGSLSVNEGPFSMGESVSSERGVATIGETSLLGMAFSLLENLQALTRSHSTQSAFVATIVYSDSKRMVVLISTSSSSLSMGTFSLALLASVISSYMFMKS